MSSDQYFYYRREWLNAPGQGTAFVEGSIGKAEREDNPLRSWYDGGSLTISDCSRQINLSFPVFSAQSRENSLTKISRLLEIVEQFQSSLLNVANKAEAAEAVRKENRPDKESLSDDVCDCPSCVEIERNAQ